LPELLIRELSFHSVDMAKSTNSMRPVDVLVDKHDFMYIADLNNHRILRWKMEDKEDEILFGATGTHFLLFPLCSM
jgi:hypothetical protein